MRAREDEAAAAVESGRARQGPPGRGAVREIEALRREAAQRCLGGRADMPPPRGRLAQPPQALPPLRGSPLGVPESPRAPVAPGAPAPPLAPASPGPSSATRPGASAAPPPPVRVPAPTMITGCDANGCWASDGTRLQRLGPDLLGPRGFCSVQGAVLSCP